MLEYYFNIENDNYRLPVNPAKLQIKSGASIESIDMTTTGKITLFSGKDVDQISFSSFWPSEDMPYCNHKNIRSPEEFKNAMSEAKNTGKQVRFIVTETDINKLFYIQSFNSEYEEGPGASRLNYDLQIIECVNPEIALHAESQKEVDSKKKPLINSKKRPSKHDEKGKTTTYTVKAGDCPWTIAKRFYGNGAKYPKIIEANKKITVNGTKLHPGMKLVIKDAK